MFSETTEAAYPSHNKYTRLSLSPPSSLHNLPSPVATIIVSRSFTPFSSSAHSPLPGPQLQPQPLPPPVLPKLSLPFNRKRHFIVLYTHKRICTTSLAVQPRNDDVSALPLPSHAPVEYRAPPPFLHPKHTPGAPSHRRRPSPTPLIFLYYCV